MIEHSQRMKTGKKPKPKRKEKILLGWREWVYLPKLCKLPMKAKVDTGAKTSALHAKNIVIFNPKDPWVSFELVPSIKLNKPIHVKAKLTDYRTIKTSLGHKTLRPVIQTVIRMGEAEFEVELTLVNRSLMGYRMLLGRQALKKRFLINPSRSFLLDKQKSTAKIQF